MKNKLIDLDKEIKSRLEKEAAPLSFALFLRVGRQSLGLTQVAFGEKIGLSRANVCDIEKGRSGVSPAVALKMAHKTGLPENMALQACLQEQVYKAGSEAKVKVTL